jgi:Tfp pilus assembly protein FimT
MRQRLFLVAIAAGVLSTLALAVSAGASPATSVTVHFNSLSGQLGSPGGPATNNTTCPAPLLNDFTSIDATGNGVTHQTQNGAGDFWFTSTFTGTATVTFYPSGKVDSQGNVTSVSGTPTWW